MPMHRVKGSARGVALALAMLLLGLGSGDVVAGPAAAGASAAARPSVQGQGRVPRMLYAPYVYLGACWPYCAGADAWWPNRRAGPRQTAPEQPVALEQDIWGTTGSPWGYVRRLPPPTPQSQIQPQYQESSTIRPEFGGP